MKLKPTEENHGYPFLFSAFKFSGYTIKNRVVALPVHTGFAYPDGRVSPLMIKWYHSIAKAGPAMVVVGNTAVSRDGVVSRFNLRADSDRFIPGLTQLAETIKQHGSIACLQLNHAGRFAKTRQPLLPSPVTRSNLTFNVESIKDFIEFFPFEKRFNLTRYFLNQIKKWRQAMTDQERERVINDFAASARRAYKAGFDMVELHGANGYLLCQYLSRFTNQITEEYGPDFNNRTRFPLKVIQAVKNKLPKNVPLGFRLLINEWVPNGIDPHEAVAFARLLEKEGISYLSASAGTYNSIFLPDINKKMAGKAYLYREMQTLTSAVNIPTIMSGRITTPDLADQQLQNGTADLIGLGRPLIADPYWLEKCRTKERITTCLNCNWCLKQVVLEKGFCCTRWPKTIQKRIHLDHQLLARSTGTLWVISSIEDIQAFKNCRDLLAPEKLEQVHPTILILKNRLKDEAFTAAYLEFSKWIQFNAASPGFTGVPEHHIIRRNLLNWESILQDVISNNGYSRVFIASNPKEAWRARLLYKQKERVMVMLGCHQNQTRVVVPVDFSLAMLLILKYLGQTLLKKNRFHIDFVHVLIREPGAVDALDHQWKKFKQIADIKEDTPIKPIVSTSSVVQTLVDTINADDYGTIIMGKRGRSQMKRWLLGSVSSGVLRHLSDQTLFLID